MSMPALFWWNINQPQDKWTNVCPTYLAGLADKDIAILKTRDEDFDRITWERCQQFIGMCADANPFDSKSLLDIKTPVPS
jgi:hypothetical protein